MFLLAFAALPAGAATLLVAAASDLVYCIDDLGAAFAREVPGAEVKLSTGSSGNFFAQIKSGAPFDLFMSADMEYPARLAREGAADGATLAPYAIGRLVLWSTDARFDARTGMDVLRDARMTRVAIANPDVAPYARAALQHYGLWEPVKARLVMGDNISQTAQFIQTGNAQAGIVSYATVLAPKQKGVGTYYLIPAAGLAPIEQGAIITRHGAGNPLAARFMTFLRSPAAQGILQRSGFSLPQ